MISIYKKFHVGYWCIGIITIICMVASLFLFWKGEWYFPILNLIAALFVVVIDAMVFTTLTSKKLSKEVTVLINECQANNYINCLKKLFEKQTKLSATTPYYFMLAKGYAVIDDYDAVYDCCQKIKLKSYLIVRRECMIDYYLNKGDVALAEAEMAELRKQLPGIRNQKSREKFEISLKNFEYAIRIKNGDYEGAEEHFKKVLATTTPLYTLTEVSYSYSLGKLLVLKGEPERAKEYLKVAYEKGGDTKYRKYAEEKLQMLAANENS